MEKVSLTVKRFIGGSNVFEDVPHTGYSTDTPGLAVCRELRRNYGQGDTYKTSRWWEVIHIASGFPIGPEDVFLTTRRDALTVATALGELADWTIESGKLVRNLALRDQAYAVFDAYK